MADITEIKMGRRPVPLVDRFWANTSRRDSNECWEWRGGKLPAGYGRICIGGDKGKTLLAHRVSWEIHHGPIENGLHVLHRCDNPACVNPHHLFLGSNADNMADKAAKNRNNSPSGPSNGAAVLSRSDVDAIRKQYASGRQSQKQISVEYGVSQTLVSAIIRRKVWQ